MACGLIFRLEARDLIVATMPACFGSSGCTAGIGPVHRSILSEFQVYVRKQEVCLVLQDIVQASYLLPSPLEISICSSQNAINALWSKKVFALTLKKG